MTCVTCGKHKTSTALICSDCGYRFAYRHKIADPIEQILEQQKVSCQRCTSRHIAVNR